MSLILNKIKEVNTKNYPVILMGDFNDTPDSKLITNLKNEMIDTKDVCKTASFGPNGTFNGFKFCEPVSNWIDYIFISNNQKIEGFKIWCFDRFKRS